MTDLLSEMQHIDTIVNNYCVLSKLNSSEQARMLVCFLHHVHLMFIQLHVDLRVHYLRKVLFLVFDVHNIWVCYLVF